MNAASEPSSPSASRLHAAVLDYFTAPGKYQLTRRQPEILFASIREVLQIAAGRGPAGSRGEEIREAAGFFIRAALLYPGADHYALLGLRSRSEPIELKERYRLLMRLIHPDFAGRGAIAWPADAATRVNRAYEVLSSPSLRRAYDEQLAASRSPQRATDKPPHANERRTPHKVSAANTPRVRIAKRAAWSFVVLASLLGIGMLLLPSDRVTLVQTKAPSAGSAKPARATNAAQPAAPAAPATVAEQPRAHSGAGREVTQAPAVPVQQPPQAIPVREPDVATVPAARAIPSSIPTPSAPAPLVAARPVADTASARPVLGARPYLQGAPPMARIGAGTAIETEPPSPRPGASPVALASTPATTTQVAVIPASAPALAAAVIRPAAGRIAESPSLIEAQPLLTQLLHLLESGNGDQLLRALDADARHHASTQALSRHYQKIVAKGGRVRVSDVEFKSENRDEILIVTGHMRLHVGDTTIGSRGEALLLRAEFASRGGRVVLTGLGGAQE